MKCLILVLLMISCFAFAGREGGNGGVVVKCEDRLRLAEFYEVEVLPGLSSKMKIIYKDEDVESQINNAFKLLASASEDPETQLKTYTKELQLFRKGLVWLNGSFAWDFTDDLGRFPLDESCKTINVINNFEDGFSDGQKRLFEFLTNTEQAALYVHEVLYKISRSESKQKTSLPARRITALLFSNYVDEVLLKSLYLKFINPKEGVFLEYETDDKDPIFKVKSSLPYYRSVKLNSQELKPSLYKDDVMHYSLNISSTSKLHKVEVKMRWRYTDSKESIIVRLNENTEEVIEVFAKNSLTITNIYIAPSGTKAYLYGRL